MLKFECLEITQSTKGFDVTLTINLQSISTLQYYESKYWFVMIKEKQSSQSLSNQ
jgi:hypothetical protein